MNAWARVLATLAIVAPLLAPLPAAASAFCPVLTRAISLGAKGDDVASLQRYLIFDGYLAAGNISGTFNVQTQVSVQQWQLAHKVITKDDDATTGAGMVGAKTRIAMLKSCGASDGSWATNGPPQPAPAPSHPPTPSQKTATSSFGTFGKCSPVTRPTVGCAAWKGVMGKNGCVASWVCTKVATSTATTTPQGNKPPYITSMTGPTSIATGTVGVWGANAVDPEGAPLAYSFAWTNLASATQGAAAPAFGSSSSTTRSFDTAGIYALTATVRDKVGNTAGTSLQISVGNDLGGGSGTSTNPGGGGGGAYCSYYNTSFQDGSTIKMPDCTPLQTNSSLCSVTGTDTMTCRNGHWFARGTADICAVNGQTTDASNVFGCYNGGWTSPNNFPPGSYGGGVIGQPCFLEGQQSFTACPNMQNCMGGGSYLVCHNYTWQAMTVSSQNDRLQNLANGLVALEALIGKFTGN